MHQPCKQLDLKVWRPVVRGVRVGNRLHLEHKLLLFRIPRPVGPPVGGVGGFAADCKHLLFRIPRPVVWACVGVARLPAACQTTTFPSLAVGWVAAPLWISRLGLWISTQNRAPQLWISRFFLWISTAKPAFCTFRRSSGLWISFGGCIGGPQSPASRTQTTSDWVSAPGRPPRCRLQLIANYYFSEFGDRVGGVGRPL